MNEYENKDEIILVLAALLHDIGKIEQKYIKNEKHQNLSYKFVGELYNINENYRNEIRDLVKFHHASVDDIGKNIQRDQQFLKKLEILKEADSLSASHDRNDQEKDGLIIELLKKIFLDIHVKSDAKAPKEDDFFPPYMIHDFIKFLETNKDETHKDEMFSFNPHESLSQYYKSIYNYTLNKLQSLNFDYQNSKEFINTATNILMDSSRLIPSAYFYSEPNIPLFDHLKLTAALALAKWRNNENFLLILGDMSGIQNYIFRYYNSGKADERASKRLRGRSFMIKLITDAVISYILEELHLYEFNVIYDSAGGFLILSDNKEGTIKKLEDIRDHIESIFMQEYMGLSIAIDWQQIIFNDLPRDDKKGEDSGNKSPPLLQKLDKLYDMVNMRKNRFYSKIFSNNNNYDKYFTIEKYSTDYSHRLCETCGMRYGREDGKCEYCTVEEDFGEKIVKNNTLYKSRYKITDEDLTITFSNTFEIHYSLEPPKKELEEIQIISINEPEFKGFEKYSVNASKKSWGFFLQGNYVPRNESGVKSIEELVGNKNIDQKDSQKNYLGIFKSDVDSMSIILSFGFKPYTFSRYSTFSFFTNMFFSIIINYYAKKHDIYIIFSGGDDLVAIGEINNIFEFSKDINKYFRKWFKNPEITISAGIVATDSSYPLRKGVELAEDELAKSKKSNKNKITIFNVPIDWGHINQDQFEMDLNIGESIYQSMINKEIGKGFPYFLISLDKYNPYKPENLKNSKNIIFPDYMLSYYLNRNMKDENKKNKLYSEIIKENNFKDIKFSAYYAVLKYRKYRRDDKK